MSEDPIKIDVTRNVISPLFNNKTLVNADWLYDKWKVSIERTFFVNGIQPVTDYYLININGKCVYGSNDLEQIQDWVVKFATYSYWFDLCFQNPTLTATISGSDLLNVDEVERRTKTFIDNGLVIDSLPRH